MPFPSMQNGSHGRSTCRSSNPGRSTTRSHATCSYSLPATVPATISAIPCVSISSPAQARQPHAPQEISPNACRPTTVAAPAIHPATSPARISATIPATTFAARLLASMDGGSGLGITARLTRVKNEKIRNFHNEHVTHNNSGNILILCAAYAVPPKRRGPILAFPFSNPLPGMFMTCRGAILRSSPW